MRGRHHPAFEATPTDAGTELRLLDRGAPVSVSDWAFSGHPGADVCQRLLAEGSADEDAELVLVAHQAIARLDPPDAARLDLPPLTSLRAVVEGNGVMLRPGFSVAIRWTRPGGQNVLGVRRVGAWLQEPEGWRRLSDTLFALAEAVEAHAAADGDEGLRLHALARLRETLPSAATSGAADGAGLLGSVTLVEADAFSLIATGEGDGLQLQPVLHRSGQGTAPLLPADRQRAFAENQFLRFPTARPIYALSGGTYLIVSAPLRRALEVVRRACSGTPGQRRAFLREPRAAIRAALGDETEEAVLESLVVETPAWSDRVIGLGLWQPRVLPWVTLETNDWFGAPAGPKPRIDARAPPQAGLMVGDLRVELATEQARDLSIAVQDAIARHEPHVAFDTPDGVVNVPATETTLRALAALPFAHPSEPGRSEGIETLVIEANETDLGAESLVRPRAVPGEAGEPACLLSTLKQHQRDGLKWLQRCWMSGAPGVLLADDMGLGKTLQGLAFLAWLREAMQQSLLARAPVLVVAPTGLLENWRNEHEQHLRAPGLGLPLLAYGRGLAALRSGVAPETTLNLARIGAADWVLTTYETLRDYIADFGKVRFAAVLLDEAQKAKTPGIRLTDAVKAINAEFRVALSGTPVENRLSDLWCIVDCAWPGYLRDLRWFSARYERDLDLERLHELKAMLDKPVGARPAPMLRRMREDWLPDLPPRREKLLSGEMTGNQRDAYDAAVRLGRDDAGVHVLEALQRLRAASLHGELGEDDDDEAVMACSVRLRLALGVLDEVARIGERALVFVENLEFMARLAGLLQRRYRLGQAPMTISGNVSGPVRQARVDRFQSGAAGFDVMLLSPRAGGVGLTLTRANHVIHLTRWWNPAVEDQCNGRVHRIGQERPVTIYVPLALMPDGRNSFDENLHALLQRKRSLTCDALLPPVAQDRELAEMLRVSLN